MLKNMSKKVEETPQIARQNPGPKKAEPVKTKGQEAKTEKKKYTSHIKKPEDLRRLLSVTMSQLRRDEIDVTKARAIFYGAGVFLSILDSCEFEARIAKLEEVVNQDNDGRWN